MVKYHIIHKLALRGILANDPIPILRDIARMTEPIPRKQPKLTMEQLKEHIPGFRTSRIVEYDKTKRETILRGNVWVHPTTERAYFKLMYLINYLKQHAILTNSAEVGLLLRQMGGGRELLQVDNEHTSVGWIDDNDY